MMIDDLLPPTRYCRLPRHWAATAVAGVLLLVAMGLVGGVARKAEIRLGPGQGDAAFYLRIIDDVAGGKNYYASATAELRRAHYPLKPVFAVREPLLTVALATLPDRTARYGVLCVLGIAVFAAWGWRLSRDYGRWLPATGEDLTPSQELARQFGRPVFVGAGLLLLLNGLLAVFVVPSYVFHEVWAGALIALALALYDPRRWWWSVALGFLAAVLRELAAPFLLAMGAAALLERRRGEAAAWGAAIVIFCGVMLLHAHLLSPYLLPGDKTSSGWIGLGGWPFVLLNATWGGFLVIAPPWILAVAVPLMLLGMTAWPGPLGTRLAITCYGYCLVFLVLGRPDNSYWGLIVTPLMGLGLLMVPGGLRHLFGSLFASLKGS